jgi:hypothetical protein
VTTWIDSRDLTKFRAGWIQNDPAYPSSLQFPFSTKEEAQQWAEGMNLAYGDQPVREYAANFGGKARRTRADLACGMHEQKMKEKQP